MIKRKRIAILTAQAEEKTQGSFITGFLEQAFKDDYDVCIFSMYKKLQETAQRETGDSNIYNLINYSMFDAVVLMLDVIQTPGVAKHIEEQVYNSFNGPVLVIDRENRYFESARMDHYTPVVKIIDHLIEVHKCRDIVFINGRKGHPHSIQREQAYRDSMEKHGITVTDDSVYYGDYCYHSGKEIVDKIVKARSYLPQAIACANDEMALGAAEQLTKYGYNIPNDIAVTGYDSTLDGRLGPCSLTSANIPSREFGSYCAGKIHAMLNDLSYDAFYCDEKVLIGGSCGCDSSKWIEEESVLGRRKRWATDTFLENYSASHNLVMDDLLSSTDLNSFYNTIFQYTYQIRDFDSFYICMNDYWNVPSVMTGEDALRHGYTEYIYPIIRCGADMDFNNSIDFDESFRRDTLLPALYTECDKPRVFFFTPMFFDDRCFGYAALGYKNIPRSYSGIFRRWMKSIMQGMEAFYRQASLSELVTKIESAQIRDSLTGLYNYRGFLDTGLSYILENKVKHKVTVVAIDIFGIREINSNYGRKTGDDAILSLSKLLNECSSTEMICSRMCNDEFLCLIPIMNEEKNLGEDFALKLEKATVDFNISGGKEYDLDIVTGVVDGYVRSSEELETLINSAVTHKNIYKAKLHKTELGQKRINAAEKSMDKLVEDIIDNNKLIYYFQPVVNARTGEIFSYEALMRADIEEKISPLDILQSAERLGRLDDVERATFLNVLEFMDKNSELFVGKKIFINSIPGCQLNNEDEKWVNDMMSKYDGQLVVEFTEESQMNDAQLDALKNNYKRLNVETAIDDYGTGYSNVDNLLRYMPRYVKIDRVLINGIYENPQKQHFVKNIIEFAHDNNIITLAEGVENAKELKEAIKYGIDLIQGFYTAKPNRKVLTNIDVNIANEIVQFNKSNSNRAGNKAYSLTDENRISLVNLAKDRYNHITIESGIEGHNIEIVGAMGFHSNIHMNIEDGFSGTVCLNNVSLSSEKDLPCIDIGNNCSVTLKLVGNNELIIGGIRIPESSVLEIEGDGNLHIKVTNSKYYAIGNDLNSRHGDIIFNLDGEINIQANGMKGVAIGSGMGGYIDIHKGGYVMDIRGQHGVAIGAIHSDVELKIDYCSLDITSGITNGAVIGSYYGNARIYTENLYLRERCNGSNVVGIGTLFGEQCEVHVKNASVDLYAQITEFYGIGGHNAKTDVIIEHTDLKAYVQGAKAYFIGNDDKTAVLQCVFAELHTDVNNGVSSDMRADEAAISLINTPTEFKHNGTVIPRQCRTGE